MSEPKPGRAEVHRPLEPLLEVGADGVMPSPRRTGRPWIDMFLAVAAILISTVSLYVAFVQGDVSRKMLAASSWPLLRYETGNSDDNYKPNISMEVVNDGVGMATVEEFHVFYKGKEERSPFKLLEDCCRLTQQDVVPTTTSGWSGGLITNPVLRSVLKSGDKRAYLNLNLTKRNAEIWHRLDKARFQVTFASCYCSVLGDCWKSDLVTTHPRPVKACGPR